MLNSVIIMGRLTADPELRTTTNGLSVTSFTVAVDNRTKDDNGKRTASFIPCVCWNAVADVVNKFFSMYNSDDNDYIRRYKEYPKNASGFK